MSTKFKILGPIKVKGNPKTKSIILQTLQKVFGTSVNGFSKTDYGTVSVLYNPQKEVELKNFIDQFLGKIKKGNYFFEEIETAEQKLSLLLDIGEPIAIQDTKKGEYQSSIYPNQETKVYVTASNGH